MYKGKKVITQIRPWWKHPIFPWGVYSLKQDKFIDNPIHVDGFYAPDDGGGGTYSFDAKPSDNGGSVIKPVGDGVADDTEALQSHHDKYWLKMDGDVPLQNFGAMPDDKD